MNRLVQSLRIRKNCDIIESFLGYFGYRERCVAADGDEFLHEERAMNNIIFSMIPFILFAFICVVLTMRRFSRAVTYIAWAVLVGAIVAVYLGLGFTRLDNAFLIALMPVTAYLPVIIAVFVLSKRRFAGNVFVISVALLACVIAGLVRKLVVTFGFDGVWGGVLCALIVAAVSAAIAFVVYIICVASSATMTRRKRKTSFFCRSCFCRSCCRCIRSQA